MTTKTNIAGIVVVGAYLGRLLTKWFYYIEQVG